MGLILWRQGITKAAVFPVPFFARANMSRPCSATGMLSSWIGEGLSKPASKMPIIKSRESLKSSNSKPLVFVTSCRKRNVSLRQMDHEIRTSLGRDVLLSDDGRLSVGGSGSASSLLRELHRRQCLLSAAPSTYRQHFVVRTSWRSTKTGGGVLYGGEGQRWW